jgi:hypothetical protein
MAVEAITALTATCLSLSAPVVLSGQDRSTPAFRVVFSAPTEGEADVRLDAHVRIQFSRHVDERTLAGRVRASYSAAESAERGEAEPPSLAFTLAYDSGTFGITLTPDNGLERFREVHVDLLDGIVAADGAVLKPWRLTFRTGGAGRIVRRTSVPVASGQFKGPNAALRHGAL